MTKEEFRTAVVFFKDMAVGFMKTNGLHMPMVVGFRENASGHPVDCEGCGEPHPEATVITLIDGPSKLYRRAVYEIVDSQKLHCLVFISEADSTTLGSEFGMPKQDSLIVMGLHPETRYGFVIDLKREPEAKTAEILQEKTMTDAEVGGAIADAIPLVGFAIH